MAQVFILEVHLFFFCTKHLARNLFGTLNTGRERANEFTKSKYIWTRELIKIIKFFLYKDYKSTHTNGSQRQIQEDCLTSKLPV